MEKLNGIFTSGTWLLHSVLNIMPPGQSNLRIRHIYYHYKVVQLFKSVLVVRGVFCWSTSGISSLCDAQKFHEFPGCECLQMSHIVQVLLFDRIEVDSARRLWLQRSGSLGFSLGVVIWMRNSGIYHPSAFVKNMMYDKNSKGIACCQFCFLLHPFNLIYLWSSAGQREHSDRLTRGAFRWKPLWPTSGLFCWGLFFLLWHKLFVI